MDYFYSDSTGGFYTQDVHGDDIPADARPVSEDERQELLKPVLVNLNVASSCSCSPWQIRKALNQLGLRDQVEAAVAASVGRDLKDGWEFATEFKADDPFVIAMGAALGKTPEETKEIIVLASGL